MTSDSLMGNQMDTPKPKLLKNYARPNFFIEKTELRVDLYEEESLINARLSIKKNPEALNVDKIKLDGEELELIKVKLNGELLDKDSFNIVPHGLEIMTSLDEFTLEIQNRIKPQNNKRLSGLYKSSGNFCTQCEAEGFRRITYYLDRPDVMSVFTTTITADKDAYSFLLSNGNLVEKGSQPNNRHFATWHDPFKKPCYLFALVAGDLALIEDNFQTKSGRDVCLQIYVEKENRNKCHYAMQALKKAMSWDEQRFNREYDLDRYMIVAVNDFNMGAMENKGLNIFNSKYVLADPDTATDRDFLLIDAVIGHEYFHNWSGNRVTCRDWFQLSLKEGLTIFREHEFCADYTSATVKRIEDTEHLRAEQFPQDDGPMAHPVRPESYIEINNFYTLTIYEKGAEVIRMIQTLVGKDGFDQGLNLYFDRHDGQAVTIEDFVKAMEDANHKDLTQFRLWYSQAGTPVLTVATEYLPASQSYTIKILQYCPPTPSQEKKEPMHIPVVVGLLDEAGHELEFDYENKHLSQVTLELMQAQQTFTFNKVSRKPIPSLLRHFSAPVKLNYDYSDEELRILMLHDQDGFNRWEARQQLQLRLIKKLILAYQQQQSLVMEPQVIIDFKYILEKETHDKLFTSKLLAFPTQRYIAEFMDVIDVDAIYHVREFILQQISQGLKQEMMNYYEHNKQNYEIYDLSIEAIGERTLKNICLGFLSKLNNQEIYSMLFDQFNKANNMTDRFAALLYLSDLDCLERKKALQQFYNVFHHDALVLDKWFSIQASSTLPSTINTIKELLQHKHFVWTNPNRVRSVIASFAWQNPLRFHDLSGEGYQLLTDAILYIDSMNPQLAARLCEPLSQWKRHIEPRQKLMRQELERIAQKSGLSKDTYEIVSKSLN